MNIDRYIKFLKNDIWRIEANKLSAKRSFLIRQLRTFLLAIRGFNENRCKLHASALTYFTLLSIVPIMAMAFGIAKGFGFEKVLEKELLKKFASHEEVIYRVIAFARSMLESASGGIIAGIGVVLLFWAVIRVLSHIEEAFNEIWGVKTARPLTRKLADYLSIMLVCPLILIMSGSMTVMVTTQVTTWMDRHIGIEGVAVLMNGAFMLLPYLFLWLLFTFIYMFMPNAAVHFRSAFVGGIIGGTLYQWTQSLYIIFQLHISNFGAIYGSFAALPLFLIWLQLSWLIVLFGAEISFAHQNVDTYEFEPDCLKVSLRFKRLMSVWVMQTCVKRFMKGEEPLTAEELARQLGIPMRLANDIFFELLETRLLVEVNAKSEENPAFQPGRPIETLHVSDVLNDLNTRGDDTVPIKESKTLAKLSSVLDEFEKKIKSSSEDMLLKEI